MDDFNGLLDLPSPSSSLHYQMYDNKVYLESSSACSSTSPTDDPYDISNFGAYPSPEHIDGPGECNSSEQSAAKPAAKRKRENRYKNAPPSVLSRRRAQNRASQRAYRERKDQRIKDLEVLLREAQTKNDMLSQAYVALQAEYAKLKRDHETSTTANAYAAQYQQGALDFDPTTIGTANGSDMDHLFLYNDTITRYAM